jgi:hypothetical protein
MSLNTKAEVTHLNKETFEHACSPEELTSQVSGDLSLQKTTLWKGLYYLLQLLQYKKIAVNKITEFLKQIYMVIHHEQFSSLVKPHGVVLGNVNFYISIHLSYG